MKLIEMDIMIDDMEDAIISETSISAIMKIKHITMGFVKLNVKKRYVEKCTKKKGEWKK